MTVNFISWCIMILLQTVMTVKPWQPTPGGSCKANGDWGIQLITVRKSKPTLADTSIACNGFCPMLAMTGDKGNLMRWRITFSGMQLQKFFFFKQKTAYEILYLC